jgi:hypothetical protein
LVFCIYNIISILDGLIYYQQTSRLTPLQITFVGVGTAILLTGVLSLSWRLSPEPGPPPLAPNPFTPPPTFELFVDEAYHDDTDHTPPNTAAPTDRRQSRVLSQVEVESLKDLLGETDEDDDDTSIIDEEPDDSVDIPVQRI